MLTHISVSAYHTPFSLGLLIHIWGWNHLSFSEIVNDLLSTRGSAKASSHYLSKESISLSSVLPWCPLISSYTCSGVMPVIWQRDQVSPVLITSDLLVKPTFKNLTSGNKLKYGKNFIQNRSLVLFLMMKRENNPNAPLKKSKSTNLNSDTTLNLYHHFLLSFRHLRNSHFQMYMKISESKVLHKVQWQIC